MLEQKPTKETKKQKRKAEVGKRKLLIFVLFVAFCKPYNKARKPGKSRMNEEASHLE